MLCSFPPCAADRIVARMAGTFYEPVGLSGCNRFSIYDMWGPTLQKAYYYY
jgi:hypothetical protein